MGPKHCAQTRTPNTVSRGQRLALAPPNKLPNPSTRCSRFKTIGQPSPSAGWTRPSYGRSFACLGGCAYRNRDKTRQLSLVPDDLFFLRLPTSRAYMPQALSLLIWKDNCETSLSRNSHHGVAVMVYSGKSKTSRSPSPQERLRRGPEEAHTKPKKRSSP
jgi:hypothetical protein